VSKFAVYTPVAPPTVCAADVQAGFGVPLNDHEFLNLYCVVPAVIVVGVTETVAGVAAVVYVFNAVDPFTPTVAPRLAGLVFTVVDAPQLATAVIGPFTVSVNGFVVESEVTPLRVTVKR